MTLDEARAQGIARLRLAMWANPHAYLRQDLMPDGRGSWVRGPWLHLFDREGQEAIGVETPQTFFRLAYHCEETTDYVPYDGPLDSADTEREANR